MKNSVKRVAQEYRKQAEISGDDVLVKLLGGKMVFTNAFHVVADKDNQASRLMYDVYNKLTDKFTLSRGDQEGLQRLVQVIENADKWDAGLLRNNIFKAAHAMGLKLPSMMFASEEKVAAGRVLKKDIRLKNHDVLPRGASAEVKFLGRTHKDGYRMCEVHVDFTGESGRNYQVQPMIAQITRLEEQVSGFKTPGMRALEKWSEDGVCLTPTGKRVEPDGYGPDGSPSWLLAMGMI